jgi:uncharacterized protein YndB with AHSA1/START domain
LEPIRRGLTVSAPPDRAFSAFTEGLGSWWPSEYTWSGEVLDSIAIEPREGGRCFERGPHGFECDWGRVLACERPRRLVFAWQISPRREPVPDPERASEVEVRFEPDGDRGTRLELEHRGFERHGEEAGGYRDALDSPEGWGFMLDRYAAALA